MSSRRPRSLMPHRIATRLVLAGLTLAALTSNAVAKEVESEPAPLPAAGTKLEVVRVRPASTAVIRVAELAARDARQPSWAGDFTPLAILQGEEQAETEVDEPVTGTPTENYLFPQAGPAPMVASPSPSLSFIGLDDIPRVGTTSITIPPDVDGAVGPNHIVETLNNNYRYFDKSGNVLSTISITTFWTPAGGSGYFDPKILYDPVQQRWIATVLSNSRTTSSAILFGVSQTSDPTGAWNLFRVLGDSTGVNWADFPCIGFNKNWIAININLFTNAASTGNGARCLIIDYAAARAGTLAASFANGTGFCSAPVATYAASENTLYAPTHLSSAGGTYRVDTITGTPAAPVYTIGATRARGLTWTQPSGAILPQAAPLAGASVCGAIPCLLETQDSQLRTTPVLRNGAIWYSQTVGVPAGGLTHTAVQWTKLDAATGNVTDGGRIEDPTANATNGGKWYAYSSMAVNAAGDVVLALSQFSSAQYPSAAYAYRFASDVAGTFRDPVVYKAGDDYYHKDFGSGRNRWGDYVKAQVDPSDDQALWVVSEYAKARTGTDDGTTGSNSSKWGTWWARVSAAVSIGLGPNVNEGNSGSVVYNIPVNITPAPAADVTVNYTVSDGTATAASGDYSASSGSVTILAGQSSANIPVTVNGDNITEPNETFSVTLTSASGAPLGAPVTATVTIVNDDAAPSIGVSDVSLAEGDAGTTAFVFTLSLSNPSSQSVTVAYATADGSANAGADYTAASGIATFAPGAVSTTVTVDVAGEVVFEPSETFTLDLSSPANATLADAQGVGTITNDDAQPTLSIQASQSVAEGNAGNSPVTLSVTLSGPSSTAITVDYLTADGTATNASGDYAGGAGVLTFPALSTAPQDITLEVTGDTVLEADETFTVTLSNPVGATIAAGTGTITIVNDEGAPVLSVADASIVEGNAGTTTLEFTVSLSGGSDQPVTATLSTIDGTATVPDGDFVLPSTSFSLPAFTTTGTVQVTVNGDIRCEADETFTLMLSAVSGAQAGDTLATGTITNDDDCTPPTVTVLAPNGGEAWVPGLLQTITWSAADNVAVTRVDIELSRDNGSTFETLSAGEANDGSFDWTVTTPLSTLCRVRVVASDAAGSSASDLSDAPFSILNPVGGVNDGPVAAFALTGVSPNPAVRSTNVAFALPRGVHVRLTVADLQGRTVAVLADDVMAAGRHSVTWNTQGPRGAAAAGVYFARLEAGSFVATRRFAVTH